MNWTQIHLAVMLSAAGVLTALLSLHSSAVSAATSSSAQVLGVKAESAASLRAAVVQLTNEARINHCAAPLTPDPKLMRSAQRHANDMAANDYFGHTSLDGTAWDQRIRAAGYAEPAAENLALGSHSAEQTMREWMRSPSHRQDIMNCEFRHVGIGYNADGGYYVQDFGY